VVNANFGVRDADPVCTAMALNKASRVSNTPLLPSRLLPRLGQFSRVGPIDPGIRGHWRCRDTYGCFPPRYALGHWVVGSRRLTLPQRMLGAAIGSSSFRQRITQNR
jgi:hypothetical protein